MTEPVIEHVDILIIGAGPVGMTLHLALDLTSLKAGRLHGVSW